jgi:hypothetical protein
VTLLLTVSGRLAGLLGAPLGQPAEIAHTSLLLRGSGQATVTLKLAARARKALRNRDSLQATLTATATGPNGITTSTLTFTLRR